MNTNNPAQSMQTKTQPKRIGYNPKRHMSCHGGYLECAGDTYRCYSNAGAYLGEIRRYPDACAVVASGLTVAQRESLEWERDMAAAPVLSSLINSYVQP